MQDRRGRSEREALAPDREPEPAAQPDRRLDPRAVMQLQRTAGNSAVSRLLRPESAMLQRFRTSHSGSSVKQVSENANLVYVDGKTLYATPTKLQDAANALAGVGALVTVRGSRDATTYNIDGVDYVKVELGINGPAVSGALYTRLGGKQPNNGGFRAFADCYRTSATASGFNPSGREQAAELRLTTGVVPVMSNNEALAHGVDRTPSARAAATFLHHALPNFAALLQAEADKLPQNTQPPDAWAEILRQLPLYAAKQPGAEKTNHARRIYKLIMDEPRARALLTSTYGIGEDIQPAMGTQLTQYNDPTEKAAAEDLGQSKWNFHWAGVIFSDGEDYVTLENCAVELEDATAQEIQANSDAFNEANDPRARTVTNPRYTKQDLINDRWYFKLYGKGEQSFHSKMLADDHATPHAITVPIAKS